MIGSLLLAWRLLLLLELVPGLLFGCLIHLLLVLRMERKRLRLFLGVVTRSPGGGRRHVAAVGLGFFVLLDTFFVLLFVIGCSWFVLRTFVEDQVFITSHWTFHSILHFLLELVIGQDWTGDSRPLDRAGSGA